jgi:methyl-accepting chemotaxis protein
VIAFPVVKEGQTIGLAGFTVSLDKIKELVKVFKPLRPRLCGFGR